jgi:hypothetical protein
MIDPVILIIGAVVVFLIIPAVLVISVVISGNRNNIETLEEANERLTEMREEYEYFHRTKQ